MEGPNLNDKYYNIVKADFRSCRPGLNELETVYVKKDLRQMLLLLKKFFVETIDLRRVKIDEIATEVPELMEEMGIYYNYDGEFKITEKDDLQEYCFFQDDPEVNLEIYVSGDAMCKINVVDCKLKVIANSTSRTDIYSGGSSEVAIEINQSAAVLMINVDNQNEVEVINNGSGYYHYKEIKINT